MNERLYHSLRTPVGEIRVYSREGLPVLISLPPAREGGRPSPHPPTPAVREVLEALEGYFAGKEIPHELPGRLISTLGRTPFAASVLLEVSRIPRGSTLSYGEVAARVGKPRAARAVGNTMARNPFPIIIPCHRVVCRDGSPGGFGGGEALKARLLRGEGSLGSPSPAAEW